MSNQTKQILFLIAMVSCMLLVSALSEEVFKTITSCLGGWQIGSWCSAYARKHWPQNGVDT